MPISPVLLAQAATELIARRQSGQTGPRLPEGLRPTDVEDGWQVQQGVTQGLGQAVGAWKCSTPSPGKLVAAPIYQPTIHHGAFCSVSFANTVNVEPEFAYVLAQDLPPRDTPYTPAEVDAAIASVHAALEICASRYADHTGLPFPEMLADGLVNAGLWLGPELGGADVGAFALTWQAGDAPATHADAKHSDGQPRAPLYWLANFLSERGIGLTAGQAIITGSFAGLLSVPLGQPAKFDYAGLASFEVQFNPA